MFYKGISLDSVKENLSNKATEEDAKLVIDAIDRTKKLGAKTYEDTMYMLETELRMIRQQKENQAETYERIVDKLTSEMYRQREILRKAFENEGTLEEIRESGEVNININVNVNAGRELE